MDDDKYLPLSQAGRFVDPPVPDATLARWCTTGRDGIICQSELQPRGRRIKVRWVNEFLAELDDRKRARYGASLARSRMRATTRTTMVDSVG